MPPVASVAAFSAPSQPVTPDIPLLASPRFEFMPPAILDRIASFVDADSKYVSEAMLDVADTLRLKNKRLNFWPHYTLPTGESLSRNTDYGNHLVAATIDCSEGFDNIVGALPDTLRVVVGDVTTGRELSEFLRIMSESKKKLIQFDFEFEHSFDAFNLQSIVRMLTVLSPSELKLYGTVPQEILNSLPHMKDLGQCVDLEEVEIRLLQYSKNQQFVLPGL
ncbi:hypothetical protein BJ741DRAFT_660893 [Chytriomyces cf. hyalinus JEL632]|nr:hypothetical protein BJ741DRAFT_660893 [Chytriomyces cf. hyalinus JEL632]